jgi:hypothetical protein
MVKMSPSFLTEYVFKFVFAGPLTTVPVAEKTEP